MDGNMACLHCISHTIIVIFFTKSTVIDTISDVVYETCFLELSHFRLCRDKTYYLAMCMYICAISHTRGTEQLLQISITKINLRVPCFVVVCWSVPIIKSSLPFLIACFTKTNGANSLKITEHTLL